MSSAAAALERFLGEFLQDTSQDFAQIQKEILFLREIAPKFDEKTVKSLFRRAHTVKGSAVALGLSKIEAAAHGLETVLFGVINEKKVFRDSLKKIVGLSFEMENERIVELGVYREKRSVTERDVFAFSINDEKFVAPANFFVAVIKIARLIEGPRFKDVRYTHFVNYHGRLVPVVNKITEACRFVSVFNLGNDCLLGLAIAEYEGCRSQQKNDSVFSFSFLYAPLSRAA